MSLDQMPSDLPRPEYDGVCDHLTEMTLPRITLTCTDGSAIDISSLPATTMIYIYPMTGKPDVRLPAGWESIPGARGCTPQACSFRDLHDDIKSLHICMGLVIRVLIINRKQKCVYTFRSNY